MIHETEQNLVYFTKNMHLYEVLIKKKGQPDLADNANNAMYESVSEIHVQGFNKVAGTWPVLQVKKPLKLRTKDEIDYFQYHVLYIIN